MYFSNPGQMGNITHHTANHTTSDRMWCYNLHASEKTNMNELISPPHSKVTTACQSITFDIPWTLIEFVYQLASIHQLISLWFWYISPSLWFTPELNLNKWWPYNQSLLFHLGHKLYPRNNWTPSSLLLVILLNYHWDLKSFSPTLKSTTKPVMNTGGYCFQSKHCFYDSTEGEIVNWNNHTNA